MKRNDGFFVRKIFAIFFWILLFALCLSGEALSTINPLSTGPQQSVSTPGPLMLAIDFHDQQSLEGRTGELINEEIRSSQTSSLSKSKNYSKNGYISAFFEVLSLVLVSEQYIEGQNFEVFFYHGAFQQRAPPVFIPA